MSSLTSSLQRSTRLRCSATSHRWHLIASSRRKLLQSPCGLHSASGRPKDYPSISSEPIDQSLRAGRDGDRKQYPLPPPNMPDEDYAAASRFAFSTLARTVKYILYGVVGLGAASYAGYKGIHIWIEYEGMKPTWRGIDGILAWEEGYGWGNGDLPGTDPRLSTSVANCIRGAWLCLEWKEKSHRSSSTGDRDSSSSPDDLSTAEMYLQYAIDRIGSEDYEDADRLLWELLARLAGVQERLGKYSNALSNLQNIFDKLTADTRYERAKNDPDAMDYWRYIMANSIGQKLADLNLRLGDTETARQYYGWVLGAISPASASDDKDADQGSVLTELQQSELLGNAYKTRILISISMSLASMAASNKQDLKKTALPAFIETHRRISQSLNLQARAQNPVQSPILWESWLRLRLAQASTHLGEVLFLLKRKDDALGWLQQAASSAAEVNDLLLGMPALEDEQLKGSWVGYLLGGGTSRPTPRARLRRSALECSGVAMNNIGLIYEINHDHSVALQYFLKALDFASDEKGADTLGQGEYTTNVDRVRNVLQDQDNAV